MRFAAGRAPRLARGADGWRAVINEGFTPAAASELASAIGAELLDREGRGSVLVAHDGRFYSEIAARAAAEALVSVGLDALLVGETSTPAATFGLGHFGCIAALVVTSSHNPFYWNGVKLKVAPGRPPGKDLEHAVEGRRGTAITAVPGGRLCHVPIEGLLEAYVSHLLAGIDADALRIAAPRVVLDGLGGVGAKPLVAALLTAGCRLETIATAPDPLFTGLVPDPMRPESRVRCIRRVGESGADIGFLVDGDGDRLAVIDRHSLFHQPHDILALMLEFMPLESIPRAGVVTTVATGSIVGRLAHSRSQPHIETAIGFKHIAPYLIDGLAVMGGGSVGDIGIRDHGFDRDPVAAALRLLALLAASQVPLDEAVRQLHRQYGTSNYHSVTYNTVKLSDDQSESMIRTALHRADLPPCTRETVRIDGIKVYVTDKDWVLVRNASTEPGVRLYSEMADGDFARFINSFESMFALE
ncbi:phosphomannomutase [Bradyrhizobium liaoningense]